MGNALKRANEILGTNYRSWMMLSTHKGLTEDFIREFADKVEAVLFVSGKHSSNGIYLYQLCKQHKPQTYLISSKEDISLKEMTKYNTIGISGATSTPMWLMEQIRDYVLEAFENHKL